MTASGFTITLLKGIQDGSVIQRGSE